jgi:hypothetical protein
MRTRLKSFINANTEMVNGKPVFAFRSNTATIGIQSFYVNDPNTVFTLVDQISVGITVVDQISVKCTLDSYQDGKALFKFEQVFD